MRVTSEHGKLVGKGSLLKCIKRIDLGLALLSLVVKRGVPLTCDDIAAWCGCSANAIRMLEKRALKNLHKRALELATGEEDK